MATKSEKITKKPTKKKQTKKVAKPKVQKVEPFKPIKEKQENRKVQVIESGGKLIAQAVKVSNKAKSTHSSTPRKIISNSPPTYRQLERELALRVMSKRKYEFFISHMFPEITTASHHKLIINKLQDVADGKIKRLMLFLPPGSAKSTYANGWFVPWYLGRQRNRLCITATHTQEFSEKWSRKSREIAQRTVYDNIFNTRVRKDAAGVKHWILTNNSEYIAVGVEGSITGARADLIIVDDPVKGHSSVASKNERDKIWNWFVEDLRTRLRPDGQIVIIMTRWHEDDLAGRLLEKEGDKWEVIKIPAECEDPATDPLGRKLGEMLWKEWFTPEMFAEAKSSPRMWASLYQQRPAPEEGAFFERSWLKYYDSIPDNLQYYGASDYAVSVDKGDYTVHVIAGFDKNDNLYIIDMWRGQTESSIWMDELVKMMKVYRPKEWGEENGVILKSLDPFIKHTMNKERIYTTRRRQFTPTSDKVSRARTFQGLMQLGKVWLPRRSNWLRDLEYEILTFPSSKHDDQVDALSTLCQLLDTMKPNYGKRTTEHYDLGKDFSL